MSDYAPDLDGAWDWFEYSERRERWNAELERKLRISQEMKQQREDRENSEPIRVIINTPEGPAKEGNE